MENQRYSDRKCVPLIPNRRVSSRTVRVSVLCVFPYSDSLSKRRSSLQIKSKLSFTSPRKGKGAETLDAQHIHSNLLLRDGMQCGQAPTSFSEKGLLRTKLVWYYVLVGSRVSCQKIPKSNLGNRPVHSRSDFRVLVEYGRGFSGPDTRVIVIRGRDGAPCGLR